MCKLTLNLYYSVILLLLSYLEIDFLKKKNRISESATILVIEDPAKNLGSGAATLNALLVATEYLSAKRNYMVC